MVPEYLTPTNGGMLAPGQLMAVAAAGFARCAGPSVTQLVLEVSRDLRVGRLIGLAPLLLPQLRDIRIVKASLAGRDAARLASALRACVSLGRLQVRARPPPPLPWAWGTNAGLGAPTTQPAAHGLLPVPHARSATSCAPAPPSLPTRTRSHAQAHGCVIDTRGAQALASLLEGSASLHTLELCRCKLRGKGAAGALAAGLRANRSLRELNLAGERRRA